MAQLSSCRAVRIESIPQSMPAPASQPANSFRSALVDHCKVARRPLQESHSLLAQSMHSRSTAEVAMPYSTDEKKRLVRLRINFERHLNDKV